jgi:hypothetical protein
MKEGKQPALSKFFCRSATSYIIVEDKTGLVVQGGRIRRRIRSF